MCGGASAGPHYQFWASNPVTAGLLLLLLLLLRVLAAHSVAHVLVLVLVLVSSS